MLADWLEDMASWEQQSREQQSREQQSREQQSRERSSAASTASTSTMLASNNSEPHSARNKSHTAPTYFLERVWFTIRD